MWTYELPGLGDKLEEFYGAWSGWFSDRGNDRLVATEQAEGAPAPDRKRFVEFESLALSDALSDLTRGVRDDITVGFGEILPHSPDYAALAQIEWKQALAQAVVRVTEYPRSRSRTVLNRPHVDLSLYTLLPSGTASGLQVLSDAGEWEPVSADPDEVIAIRGKALGLFCGLKPELHRVVSNGAPRLSVSIFVNAPRSNFVSVGTTVGEWVDSVSASIRRKVQPASGTSP